MNIALTSIGRYGDTILASIIVNMLVADGHTVKWITSQPYLNLAATIAPGAEMGIHPLFKGTMYTDEVSSTVLRDLYPGHDAYINAQFGAREEYSCLSGKHPLHWLRDKVEKLTGIGLGTNWKDFLIYRNEHDLTIDRDLLKPLAIISPHIISARPPVFTPEKLQEIHELLCRKYDVRLLVEKAPEEPDGYRYLDDYSFVDAIKIIQMADHFVGQDSGLSWAALYSSCSKEVYLRRARYDTYKFSFAEVDPNVVENFV